MPNDEDEVAARPPGPDHAMTDTAAVINQFNNGGRPVFGTESRVNLQHGATLDR